MNEKERSQFNQPNTTPSSQNDYIAANDDTTQPVSTAPSASSTRARKKKMWFIVGGALAALIIGLILTYLFWYQNPNKVVADSLANAITAKTVTYTGDVVVDSDTKTTIEISGAQAKEGGTLDAKLNFDIQGTTYDLDGSVVMDDKSDLYFKVKNIDELVGNYRLAVPEESRPLFDQMIEKINDKWIKVSADDIKSFSAEYAKTQECLTAAATKLQDDKTTQKEIEALYRQHQFITIEEKLGAKDGSLGYKLGSDQETAKAFATGLRDTEIYKSLQDCDDTFTIDDKDLVIDENASDEQSTVEIWVDRWSHQLTKVVASTESDGDKVDMTIAPTFNEEVTIETPSDSTTIAQLQADMQSLLGAPTATPAE